MNIPNEGYSPRKIPQNVKHAWFSQPGGVIPLDGGKWELCVGGVWGLCIYAGIRVTRAGTRRRTRVGARLWRRDSKIGRKPNTRLTIHAHRTLNVNMLQFAMSNIAGQFRESAQGKGNGNPAECGTSAMRSARPSVCARKANNPPSHPSPLPRS